MFRSPKTPDMALERPESAPAADAADAADVERDAKRARRDAYKMANSLIDLAAGEWNFVDLTKLSTPPSSQFALPLAPLLAPPPVAPPPVAPRTPQTSYPSDFEPSRGCKRRSKFELPLKSPRCGRMPPAKFALPIRSPPFAPPTPPTPPAAEEGLLESPGCAEWNACLDELKKLLPKVLVGFVSQLEQQEGLESCRRINEHAVAKVLPKALWYKVWAPLVGGDELPVVRVPTFIHDVRRKLNPSESTMIIAFMYVERLCLSAPGLALNTLTVKRLFSVAMLLAFKYNEERNYNMNEWAATCGIQKGELLKLEILALQILEHKLFVSRPNFEAFVGARSAPRASP